MRPSLLVQMTFVAALGFAGGTLLAPHGNPVEAAKALLSSSPSAASKAVGRRSGSCTIKGNVSYNRGQRIYHVVGQRDYDRTIITPSRGERWFCSEEEARAAGWRKAGR
jgi:hypothetical protein